MKISKPCMMLSAALLISPLAHSQNLQTSTKRIIIFGDSLSDTGNYPEPSTVSSPDLKNFNLYVPITNPVPLGFYGNGFTPSINFLSKSIQVQGTINGKKRALYSINWPLYFVYNSGNQQALVTWYQHYLNPSDRAESINYAWASAIAGGTDGADKCYHDDGTNFPGKCDAKSIVEQRNSYLNHTASDPNYDKKNNYSYTDLKIPDLGKQVSLYLNDKNISVKKNTLFIIYIGANDIGNFLKSKSELIKIALLPSYFFKRPIEKHMKAAAENVIRAVNKIKAAYQKTNFKYEIYVLTLPNFSSLHEGHTYGNIPFIGSRITSASDYAVKAYNQDLKKALKNSNNIVVVNLGKKINSLAAEAQYQAAIKNGATCIDDPSGDYINPSKQTNLNCHYFNKGEKSTYFSWNNAHYVAQINQAVASFLLENRKANK